MAQNELENYESSWFTLAKILPTQVNQDFVDALTKINNYLQMRSFFQGYNATDLDKAIFTGLESNSSWKDWLQSNRHNTYPHLFRWYSFLSSNPHFLENDPSKTEHQIEYWIPMLNANLQETITIDSKSKGQTEIKLESKLEKKSVTGRQLKDLPNAIMGQVVTRFPPEPSGFLHIGHCKASLLNYNYAKRYNGRFIVRFDDTNPNKEKEAFADSILEDLKMMGILPEAISHTSDYFDLMMEKCESLIRQGLAYCDATPVEQMRREKIERIESAYRYRTIAENLEAWQNMKLGNLEGQRYLVRAKINMQSHNGTMRDPGLYRVSVDTPHLRTGTTYKVYPLYDFSCPIVDSIEGVTHVMRSSEFHDRDEQYAWLLNALNFKPIPIVDFSRLNFTYQLLSKRKLQWFVDQGLVDGWNDPRLPTLRGLFRRGLTYQALEEFILAQGASKNINLMDMSKLWAINRMMIDPIVPRYTAVAQSGAVLMRLENGPAELEGLSRPRHKKNAALGTKIVHSYKEIWIEGEDAKRLQEGEELTLMDWGNAIVDKMIKDEKTGEITEILGRLHLEGDFKKTKCKLTWLANLPQHLVCVTIIEYDHLINKPSLGEGEKFEDFLTPITKYETKCYGDPNLRYLQREDKIQLERRGYFRCEEPMIREKENLVLISIPDGSQSGPSILSHRVQLKVK